MKRGFDAAASWVRRKCEGKNGRKAMARREGRGRLCKKIARRIEEVILMQKRQPKSLWRSRGR